MLAVVLAVVGCGASADEPATGTLSKEQFLRKANALCAQGTEEMNRLDIAAWKRLDPDFRSQGPAVPNKVALALLPARETELRDIRALGLPRGDEQFVEAMLEAWQEGIEIGRERPRLLRAAGSEWAFQEAYDMGLSYGLEKCWLS